MAPVAVARTLFGPGFGLAEQYVDILASRGVEWGLIGPREIDRLWPRHVLNSLALADLIPDRARVVDVGSGAGLPGIPLALARADLQVTLLEPLLRRANFLTEAVTELGLADRVTVCRARAEDHHERYDAVVSRAVAALPKLLPWCLPLLKPGGQVLALKGESAEQELLSVNTLLRSRRLTGEVLASSVHADLEPTWVVRVR